MARRGTFGRSPRPAQSLTNTIVAIAREMQSQRDQNLMQAWQKGGLFEGGKATDERVLAHWKRRMTEVSKDDPMYNAYQNAYAEYDYAIHESKMTVLYAQEKIDDKQAAAFYLNWAKKVPKNTEFWRVLQRDAAQYMRAAKAKAKVGEAARLEAKYQSDMSNIHKNYEAAGEYAADIIKELAERGSRDGVTGAVIAEGGSLMDLAPNADPSATPDPDAILRLIDLIGNTTTMVGSAAVKHDAVLMYDDMGKPVTGADITAEFNRLTGGKHEGPLTYRALQDAVTRKKEGLVKRIALADKTGHQSDKAGAEKELEFTAALGRRIDAWPVEQEYLDRKARRDSVLNNPKSSPPQIAAEIENYRAYVAGLAQDPRVRKNDILRNTLIGESQGRAGTITLSESYSGVGDGAGEDVARTSAQFDLATRHSEAVASGAAVWTYGEYENGVFVPAPGGTQMGAATEQQISSLSGGVQPQVAYVQDGAGTPRRVVVMGQDIMASAINPLTGAQVTKTGNVPIGQTYLINGEHNFYTEIDGVGSFSKTPSWDPRLPLVETATGYELNMNSLVPQPGAETTGTGFVIKADGTKQALIMNPLDAARLSDPTHLQWDPHTDHPTLTESLYSDTPEGKRTLAQLAKSPEYQADREAQLRAGTGQSIGPDGLWQGGDPEAYNRTKRQSDMATKPGRGGGSSWMDAQTLWDRAKTGNRMLPDGGKGYEHPSDFAGGGTPGLYSDGLEGTSFAALSMGTHPGTLTPTNGQPAGTLDESLATIRTSGTSLKVPKWSGTLKGSTPSPTSATPSPTPAPPVVSTSGSMPGWASAQPQPAAPQPYVGWGQGQGTTNASGSGNAGNMA